jgi:hypothetical protein
MATMIVPHQGQNFQWKILASPMAETYQGTESSKCTVLVWSQVQQNPLLYLYTMYKLCINYVYTMYILCIYYVYTRYILCIYIYSLYINTCMCMWYRCIYGKWMKLLLYISMAMGQKWLPIDCGWLYPPIICHLRYSHVDSHVDFQKGVINWSYFHGFTDGSVSKPCTPVVHIKIAGGMFIPLKMLLIGIDPYPDKMQH